MQRAIKGTHPTYSWKRLIYTVCFLLFGIINQRCESCTGLDDWLYFFRDLTGAAMAVITMTHFQAADIRRHKLPYLVWTGLCAVGIPLSLLWGRANREFFYDWIVIVLDVVLYGYVLIYTFISAVLEKKLPKMNLRFVFLWLAMMLLMMLSESTYIWPFCYTVMFGCFYLTDFSAKECDDLFHGMLDGIILSFFLLQGWSFLFRPYDTVRYHGAFQNSNRNALYYLEVLAAVLVKLLYVTRSGKGRLIRLYYWLGAGVVLSFELLTIGRTGWVTAILLLLLFLGLLKKIRPGWWRNCAVLIACVMLTFPLCFGAARYFPAIFTHPIWFYGEWSEDKVLYGDPWNSEKYIEWNEYFEAASGRLYRSFADFFTHSNTQKSPDAAETPAAVSPDPTEAPAKESPALAKTPGTVSPVPTEAPAKESSVPTEAPAKESPVPTEAPAKESPAPAKTPGAVSPNPTEAPAEKAPAQNEVPEELPPNKVPVLSEEQETDNSILLRRIIYGYYFRHLNFRGHPYEEQGFQLTQTYWITHAHNLYLQYGTDFGIPVMLLLIALLLWAVRSLWRLSFRHGRETAAAGLMYVLIPAVFGLFEYSWGVGSLSILMLFVSFRQIICPGEEQDS